MPARSSLPVRRGRLIGRETELLAIREQALREDGRLVTMTGTGGVGKTTLALEVARSLATEFTDGVALIDLRPVRDREAIAVACCESLGLVEDGRSPGAVLVEHLAARQILLVLDNCEHLLPELGPLVERLLDDGPDLRVLATSRAPLRVHGESVVVVAPMRVPDQTGQVDLVVLRQVPAVDLFVERATAVRSAFTLGDWPAEVASICRRLDGLPLAIELAAAQTIALSPAEINQRLAPGHRGPGDAGSSASRRSTMDATLDWSHDLLDEVEQATFRRLAVFAGGWTLAAAEAVCALGADPSGVARTMVTLVEASLVVREGDRFRMLVPVADYAARRLERSGERGAASLAHAQHYLALICPPSSDWRLVAPQHLDLIMAEYDNCLASLRFAEGARLVPLVLGLDVSLLLFWRVRGLLRSGQQRLEAAIDVVGREPTRERGLVLAGLAHFAQLLGETASAERWAHDADAVFETVEDAVGRRMVVNFLGDIAADHGDLVAARGHYHHALDLAAASGSELDLGLCHANIGRLAVRGGDYTTAERALELARTHLGSGPRWYLAHVLVQLGSLARRRGDVARAEALLGEALTDLQAYGAAVEAIGCLDELARVALNRRDPLRAATLFSAADSLRDSTALAVPEPDRQMIAGDVERVRAGLTPGEFSEAWGRGRGVSLREAAQIVVVQGGVGPRGRADVGVALTPRERQVAALVAEGLSNARIGERLAIAPGTARIHVERILGKRGLTSRVQIATWMLREPESLPPMDGPA